LSEFENKVLEMLKKIDEKLDKVLGAKASTESVKIPEEVTPAKKEAVTPAKKEAVTPAKKEVVKPTTMKPSEVVEKQVEAEKIKEKPPVEGRRICKCGSTEFNTVEDKTKVLFQQGGMKVYAKKLICKKCGEEHL
jgi:hypothetical protein